jgi:hypothetical protein
MDTRYSQISREVGFVGQLLYPSMEEMDQLLSDLSLNPTIDNFRRALALYRFIPEAETDEEQRIVYMLQLGLSFSKRALFSEEDKQPVLASAISYIMNLLP